MFNYDWMEDWRNWKVKNNEWESAKSQTDLQWAINRLRWKRGRVGYSKRDRVERHLKAAQERLVAWKLSEKLNS